MKTFIILLCAALLAHPLCGELTSGTDTGVTRLNSDFFAFGKPLKFQEDFDAALLPLVVAELQRRFPDMAAEKSRALAEKIIDMQDPPLPGKKSDEAGFCEFFAIHKFFRPFNTGTERQKKLFLDYALRLARKYPENLVVAQTVFRGLSLHKIVAYQTEKQLKSAPIHPYLLLMLQGEYFLQKAWKLRGGGYADTVSQTGWQGFRENLEKARPFFAEAHARFPDAPEAPEKLMELAVLQNDYGKMLYYFRQSLLAQADCSGALQSFCWYSRPRWGGSTAQLLADAEAFFAQQKNAPGLALNGIWILQTYLTELPVIDGIRYWTKVRYYAGKNNYLKIRDLFEALAGSRKLSPARKMFWGTAALFAGDDETADKLTAQMDDADRKFAANLRYGDIPQLYWLDFPALHRAFNNSKRKDELRRALHSNLPRAFRILKEVIANSTDKNDKNALIDLYIMLKGDISLLDFRWKEPAFIRLCVARESNMQLIREVIAMGVDVDMTANYLQRRPLFYAMKDEKSGELLELLLNAGADVHGRWKQSTPLGYSLRYKFPVARVERLLQAGADPNRKYHTSFSSAHAAYKNLQGMKLLVKYGAELNEVSEYGQTPLDLAEKYGADDVAEFLRSHGAKRAAELK